MVDTIYFSRYSAIILLMMMVLLKEVMVLRADNTRLQFSLIRYEADTLRGVQIFFNRYRKISIMNFFILEFGMITMEIPEK